MNIAFDLDGTLTTNWTERVYLEQIMLNKEDCTYEEFWLQVFPSYSPAKQKFFTEIPFLYSYKSMKKEFVSYLWELSKNNTIFYITCRPKPVHLATVLWLEKQKLPCLDNIFFSKTDKISEIRSFEIDWLVDDTPMYLDKNKEFCQGILIETPWNEDKRQGYITAKSILDTKHIFMEEYENC